VEAMRKDAGGDPKMDTPLQHAFSVMNLGVTSRQRAAFNDFRLQLYVEADRLRDKCRITRGMHPADADRLMELICSIPVFEK
jgi:hypothetical protein